MVPALAAEEFDVADHLDIRFAGELYSPMRRRMGERNARREHQRGNLRPIDPAQVSRGDSARIRLGDARRIVIERDDVGAAGQQRTGADQARSAEPKHRNFFAGKGRDRNHAAYLSFRVESPARASTTDTIQKRITICGSVQPSCSK